MKIQTTLGEISRKGDWEQFCELKRCNPYALNEGADPKEKIYLSLFEGSKIFPHFFNWIGVNHD